jgi:hypothetical protein
MDSLGGGGNREREREREMKKSQAFSFHFLPLRPALATGQLVELKLLKLRL